MSEKAGFAAFHFRDFRFHCAGRFFLGIGLNVQSVAIGWYVYSITGSALALGFAGLAAFLPAIAFVPITGHVADTHNRRTIVALSFALCACSSAGLLTIVLLHVTQLAPIYACIVLTGTGRAFSNPAMQALTPNLVPPEHFANAVTWFSSAWSAANISGPAIGGFIYILGPRFAFATSCAVFAAAAVCMALIRYAPRTGAVRERIRLSTITAGLTFIRSRQEIFGAISLDLVAVLFGGATALLPIVADQVLASGPWALGLLRASPAIGAIGMGAWLAHHPIRSRAGSKMLISVALYGVALIGFGLSHWLALSMALLAVSGAADQISVVVRHTMVQSDTPDDMRGRVSAVNAIFIGASGDVGEFESGLTAFWFGVIPAIVLGGALTVLTAGAWAAMFPKLRRRNKLVE